MVLGRDVGSHDHHGAAGVADLEVATLGNIHLERLEAPVGAREDAGDHRRHAHRHTRGVADQHLDARHRDRDAIDLVDLGDCGDREGLDIAAHLRADRDDELVLVVGAPAADQGVHLVGHRAENDERHDADGDAGDRQARAELASAEVSEQSHWVSPLVFECELVFGFRIRRRRACAFSSY